MSCYDEVLAHPFMDALSKFDFPFVCPEVSHHTAGRYFRYWKDRNIARCYGGSCGRGSWTIIDMIMHYKGIDFSEALKLACETLKIKYRAVSRKIERADFWNGIAHVPGEYRAICYQTEIVPQPTVDWQNDRFRFAASLFFKDEQLLIANTFYQSAGRPVPTESRLIVQTAEKINNTHLVDNEHGAWICINPIIGGWDVVSKEGKRVRHCSYKRMQKGADAVSRYSYLLVESDTMPIDEQYSWLKASRLPILTLTHSGGKSLHAIILLDAQSEEEYNHKALRVYEVLQASGFSEDPGNTNANRYTRLPGVMRGEKPQYMIDVSSWDKCSSIDQWLDWMTIKPSSECMTKLSALEVWNNALCRSLPFSGLDGEVNIRVYNGQFLIPFISLSSGDVVGVCSINKNGQISICGEESYYPCLYASHSSSDLFICSNMKVADQMIREHKEATYYLSYDIECLEIWPVIDGLFDTIHICHDGNSSYSQEISKFKNKHKTKVVEHHVKP